MLIVSKAKLSQKFDLTPVEHRGRYFFKRDDLFEFAGVRGAKVRACLRLAENEKHGLVAAGNRASPQINRVAHVAHHLGLKCRGHTASGSLTPELLDAQRVGAEIIQHKPGYNSVIIKRAHEDARRLGWLEVPFGMQHEISLQEVRLQVRNVPPEVKRLVVPVGSGMTLAGVLWGMRDCNLSRPVVGVMVGMNPMKRLRLSAPPGWSAYTRLVSSGMAYSKEAAVTEVEGLELDPIYEAKCLQYLRPGDLLWCVGIHVAGHAAANGKRG